MRIRSFVVLAGAAALGFPAASAAATAVTSPSFAGYGQNNNSGHSSLKVSATLVVPKLKCGKKNAAFTPNIGVESSNGASWSGLVLVCSKGKQHGFLNVGVNEQSINYKKGVAVRAGDTVVLTAVESGSKTTDTILDKTRKFKKQHSGPGATSVSDPWIGENIWLKNPLPNFGTLRFTNGRVNGQPFGSWPGGLTRWKLEATTGGGIKAGPFTSGGTEFSTHYLLP